MQVNGHQQATDRLGTDFSGKAVIAVFVLAAGKIVFGQQLVLLERRQAGLSDDIVFEIEDPLDVFERHVQHHGDAAGQGLQEPDMGNRAGQLNMAHALAPDPSQRDFNAALLADNALIFHALILAAQAFIILGRAKDTGAEQAITLRLERAVIDGFRLLDLAKGPRADLLGRSQRDADLIEGRGSRHRVEDIEDFLVHRTSISCSGLGPVRPKGPWNFERLPPAPLREQEEDRFW